MSFTHGTQPAGQGTNQLIQISQPAVAAEFTHTVPANVMWEFVLLTCNIDTDANTFARRLHLTFSDGSNVYFKSASQSFTTPNANHGNNFFNVGQIIGGVVNVAAHHIAMPSPLYLMPGFIIRSATTGLQAGDQIETIFLTVNETMSI